MDEKKVQPKQNDGHSQFRDRWKRLSKLDKIFLLLLILCILIIIILFVLLVRESLKVTDNEKLCLSSTCIYAATRIGKGLDQTVNPCDNFYDYACGGWIKSHAIPPDRSNLASYGVLRDELQLILKNLLAEDVLPSDRPAIVKTKDLYRSCMNETQINAADITVAYQLLRDVGGWPILGDKPGGNWNRQSFSLNKLLASILKYYNIPYVYPYVYKDSKNTSRRILYFDNPGFILPERKYYLEKRDSDVLKAYEELGYAIAVDFGADKEIARRDMKLVLDLEIELANISTPMEERRDNEKLYNKHTLREMKEVYPESTKLDFSWLGYMQAIFQIPGLNLNITAEEEVIVRDPEYYRLLMSVLERYDKRTIANFAVWKLMKNRARNLPQRFLDYLGNYGKVLYGSPRVRPRWRICTSYVVDYMGLSIGRLFVQSHFDEEANSGLQLMIDGIQSAFKEILSSLSWMDEDTRYVAKDKVDYISRKIGYDPDIMNDDKLDERYENVTVDPFGYFDNVLKMLNLAIVEELSSLRYNRYKMAWETAPSTVNAYYNPQQNRIMFPAGILQPPYYHKHFPRSLNYGGIGSLIGHEITHGFDDRGRQFNKYGELHQWWPDNAILRFKNLSQCLIDQYGNFSYKEAGGMKVNGIITLGENIADNGAIKQSFRAYRNYVKSRGSEEPVLPGLSLTNNQLFFINFAQIRCAVMLKQDAINHLLTGPHSPSRFRNIGTLQNLPEFSQVFNCPRNSYMNPIHKCRVW